MVSHSEKQQSSSFFGLGNEMEFGLLNNYLKGLLQPISNENDPEISSSNNNNTNFVNNNYSATNQTNRVNRFSHEDNYSEWVQVKSSAHVSFIVGKQGSKIRQIRNETSTHIQTPVNGDDPIFVLKGKKDNVLLAKGRINEEAARFDMELFRDACGHTDGVRRRIHLFLPPRFIGLVVGKKGNAIKRIMDLSGAQIVTPKVNTLNGFKLFGTNLEIRKAIDLIKAHISTFSLVNIIECEENMFEINLKISPK